ncbi:hypothetical protein EV643_116217 [Kribbella sp. VKM Ac-2527]|uniref:Toxin-antitoxin system, toxin component n=1 Tax=Kribbella caucasensis TaxID=2512215 RepID=A0A4R6KA80_9ACTN|nr:toxin-antitoxin system, toxin component [Kribbella sp. VKM Ac-2527]TDO44405.1 hypothetical protein EV643_116217 [Kribbella sp. VKM Ac-2527]
MTTTPPQPPPNQYPAPQPGGGGYGPPQQQYPQQQYPQYAQQQPGAYQQGQHGGPQYGQSFPGQPQPQPGPRPGPQDMMQCRFCGAVPAVPATVRGHQGLLIMMRFLKLEGPFCKTCGTATVRDMTAKSLWQGWWGIGSAIINPITMLMNLGPSSKFKNLPEPAPGAPGRPMDPGKPLFKRPQILFLLVPVPVIALIVYGATISPSSAAAGDCIQNKGTSINPDVRVVDCGSADAEYKVLGKVDSSDETRCEQYEGYTVAYTEERGSSAYTLCLGPK